MVGFVVFFVCFGFFYKGETNMGFFTLDLLLFLNSVNYTGVVYKLKHSKHPLKNLASYCMWSNFPPYSAVKWQHNCIQVFSVYISFSPKTPLMFLFKVINILKNGYICGFFLLNLLKYSTLFILVVHMFFSLCLCSLC